MSYYTFLFSVDEVLSLRQQLKASQCELRKSNKSNVQLRRDIRKLDERLQSTMKMQKLIAERQLAELNDGGATSAMVASTQDTITATDARPSKTSEQSMHSTYCTLHS